MDLTRVQQDLGVWILAVGPKACRICTFMYVFITMFTSMRCICSQDQSSIHTCTALYAHMYTYVRIQEGKSRFVYVRTPLSACIGRQPRLPDTARLCFAT